MPQLPSPEWTGDQYEEWLKYAFEYLAGQWADDDGPSRYGWEDVCRRGFVEILDISESQVDTMPQLAALKYFVTYVNERFADDFERRTFLLSVDKRRALLQEATASLPAASGAKPGQSQQSVATLYWVTEDQRNELRRAVGDKWDTVLKARLTATYPGWEQNTDPKNLYQWAKLYWASMMSEFAPPDVSTLYWVTKEQRDKLGAGWETKLRKYLDEQYTPWKQNTRPEPLVKWLDDWMPTITGKYAPAPVAPPPPPVDTFYWVTEEQRKSLGDDWENTLRRFLDEHYKPWKQNSKAEPLVKWLNDWMPTITGNYAPAPVAPPPPARTTAAGSTQTKPNTAQQAPAQQAAKLVSDAGDFVLSNSENLAGRVPDDVFRQIVAEVLAERALARR